MDSVFFIFEIVGTVAFSVSGAIVAVKKDMDVFGVVILGVTTAVGGGIIRDLMLGITPPNIVNNDILIIIAFVSALIVCLPVYQKMSEKNKKIGDIVLLVSDSLGLAFFTVSGMSVALAYNVSDVIFLIFTGVISGIGGGILRDVFCGEIPLVFSRHFYACASLIGAGCCLLLRGANTFNDCWRSYYIYS